MGAVASKRRRRRGGGGGAEGGEEDAQTKVTTLTPAPQPPTLAVGLGDAILDLILVSVPHARLRDLGIEPGGCVQVASAQIDALLDALAGGGGGSGGGGGGGGDGGSAHAERPQG
jgi:hypothetical protein